MSRRRRAWLTGGAVLLGLLVLNIVAGRLVGPHRPVDGDLDRVRSDRPGVRVLFVGNRIVSQNALIELLRDLAAGDPGAPPIFAAAYAPRGSGLQEAARDDDLRAVLDDERWNHVVLQEHSQTADRRWAVRERMIPGATTLDRLARNTGARTVLLVQGAYEEGNPDVAGDTYRAMQARLDAGYRDMGARLHALLAPVGVAWADTRARRPRIELYGSDGIRPSRAGSYLIACVMYAVLTGRDPAGSRFTAGLDAADAAWLQASARRSVRSPMT